MRHLSSFPIENSKSSSGSPQVKKNLYFRIMLFLSDIAFLKSQSKQLIIVLTTSTGTYSLKRFYSHWMCLFITILIFILFAWPRKPSLTFQCFVFNSIRYRNMAPYSIYVLFPNIVALSGLRSYPWTFMHNQFLCCSCCQLNGSLPIWATRSMFSKKRSKWGFCGRISQNFELEGVQLLSFEVSMSAWIWTPIEASRQTAPDTTLGSHINWMIWQWSVSTSQTLLGGKGFSVIKH